MQDVCPLLFNQPSQASKALPACQNKTAAQSDPIRVVIFDVLDPASSPKSAEKQTNRRRNLCSTRATRITSVRHCSSSRARLGRQCKPNRTNRTASIRGMKIQVIYFYFPWVRLRFQPESPSETEKLEEDAVHS